MQPGVFCFPFLFLLALPPRRGHRRQGRLRSPCPWLSLAGERYRAGAAAEGRAAPRGAGGAAPGLGGVTGRERSTVRERFKASGESNKVSPPERGACRPENPIRGLSWAGCNSKRREPDCPPLLTLLHKSPLFPSTAPGQRPRLPRLPESCWRGRRGAGRRLPLCCGARIATYGGRQPRGEKAFWPLSPLGDRGAGADTRLVCLTWKWRVAAIPGSDRARAGPAPRWPPLRGARRGARRSPAGPPKGRAGEKPRPAPRVFFRGRTCE